MELGRPRKPLGFKPVWVRIPPPPQSLIYPYRADSYFKYFIFVKYIRILFLKTCRNY